jgi:hypothetical protein
VAHGGQVLLLDAGVALGGLDVGFVHGVLWIDNLRSSLRADAELI